jgi:hypothetical protein
MQRISSLRPNDLRNILKAANIWQPYIGGSLETTVVTDADRVRMIDGGIDTSVGVAGRYQCARVP